MDAINALTEAALLAERMEEIQKEEKVQIQKKEVLKHDGQGNMLRCSAAVNSKCGGKECVVSCSEGKGEKVCSLTLLDHI